MREYRTTVQPLWRDGASEHFNHPDGVYHAPTAPLIPPNPEGMVDGKWNEWKLHSVQPLPSLGVPKLLVVWELVR